MTKTVGCCLLFCILLTAILAQTADQNVAAVDGANPLKELIQQFAPVVQKLFSFVANPNSSALDIRALLELVDLIFSQISPVPELPEIRQDTWWGNSRRPVDESIRRFQVQFSDEMINDLKSRIQNRHNFTAPILGVNNKYGMNSNFLTQMLDYWQNTYDFQARQVYLNKYPQFVTKVQGLDIHYLHIKPETSNKRVVTILLLHGAPLTLFEYTYVIDYLSTPRDDADFDFEIIAADLPGHGYSEATSRPGLNGYQVGIIMKNLMRKLGHEKFYLHAGDVGTWASTAMATMYPEDILGLHTNFAFSALSQTLVKTAIGQLDPAAVVEPEMQDRMYPLTDQLSFFLDNFGYLHMHATRPDSFGIGADATPAGLAAWILPLMMSGASGREANNFVFDGNLYQNYNINDLFDSLTIYWDSHCMTTSARFYVEQLASLDPVVSTIGRIPIKVPLAVVKFPDEIIYQPDAFIEDKYPNLVQSINAPAGGHYAGFEKPRDLSDSIWSAIPRFESFHARMGQNN